MEFDQLRYFLKVAEHGNFTRAAESLLLSQPALSRSIQKLEDELGQPLFERQTRRLALTPAGELLVGRARQILTLVEETRNEICDDGRTGKLRVGAIPTIAPYYLPGVLQAFAQAYPEATLTVQEDTTENLLKRCSDGEIDLAVLALPITAKYLEIEPLFEEDLWLVLPPEHPLATKKRIQLRDVEPYPFVLLDEAHCLCDHILSFCRQRSFQPVTVERTRQLAMVQELVSLGHGVSMIPDMARVLDPTDRRVYRQLSGVQPKRIIAAAWNPYRFQSRLLKAFRQVLREYGRGDVAPAT